MSMLLDRFVKLVEARQRIEELTALIQRQRRLIQEMGDNGHDAMSAQIVLDSLLISQLLLKRDAAQVREKIEAELGRQINFRL
jgi:hypothetical protein